MTDLQELQELLEQVSSEKSPSKKTKARGKIPYRQNQYRYYINIFMKRLNIKAGTMRVPTYVMYYLYQKSPESSNLMNLKKQSFYRYLSRLLPRARSGSQRYYLVDKDCLNLTRDLLIEAKHYEKEYEKRRPKISKKKQKSEA